MIAVIDNDPSVLKSTARVLSMHGFDVELYDSASKFRESVQTTRAICLIVDIQLGDVCGIELVRQLADRGIRFPVIFVSANDDEDVARRAREVGCVAFFPKPISSYLLIEALHDLCDDSRWSTASPGSSWWLSPAFDDSGPGDPDVE